MASRLQPLRWTHRTLTPIRHLARYSTADTPPPLMQKLKGDLKSAMRAKDAPRLAVLRTIMAANLNASKTSSPLKTDVQVVALIRKLQKAGEDAVAEAKAAKRDDLVDKEMQQIGILREYVEGSGVVALGEAEIKDLVKKAVEAAKEAGGEGKALIGEVMKRLNGEFEGKDVDRKAVAALVKQLTS